MRTARPWVFFAGLVLMTTAGCQAPPQPAGPTSILLRIPDYEAFFDSALTLLREHDFQPRLADRVAGLALTHPSTGGQWFEFWRGDSRGGYQLLESSLHTVRRTVRLSIRPEPEPERMREAEHEPVVELKDQTKREQGAVPEQGENREKQAGQEQNPQPSGEQAGTDWYRLSIEVYKERFSAPQRQVTTASGALQIYSERLPTEEGLRASRVRGEHWVSLGRDALLEEYLLDRLRSIRPDVQIVDESSPQPYEQSPPSEGDSPAGPESGST